jgi:hypothetical protein
MRRNVTADRTGPRIRRSFLGLLVVLSFLPAEASRMMLIRDTVSHLDRGDSIWEHAISRILAQPFA